MKPCRSVLGSSFAVVVMALLLTGCVDFEGELLAPTTIHNWTQVYVRNSSQSEFRTAFDSDPVPVGGISHVLGHSSQSPNLHNPHAFEISRSSKPLVRITYRVLRFPTGKDVWHSVDIVVTEQTAGTLSVAIPDSSSSWVRLESVESL